MLRRIANVARATCFSTRAIRWAFSVRGDDVGSDHQLVAVPLGCGRRRGRCVVRTSAADLQVFEEIFVSRDYAAVLDSGLPPDACIIDVGANIGLAGLFVTSSLRNPKVLCVEPLEENVRILRQNAAFGRGHWSIVTAAVSAQTGMTDLYWSEWWSSATLNRSIGDTRRGTPGRPEHRASGGVREVRAVSLEEIVDQAVSMSRSKRVDLLKLDIEGAEEDVVPCSSASLRKVDRVIIDVHRKYIDPRPVQEALVSAGLRYCGPCGRDGEFYARPA